MRREGALQDDSLIQSVLAGRATYQQAFDYYLGFLSDPSITDHYQPLQASQYTFVQQWGMAVAMNDLNAVIQKARDGGTRTVTLGGHSLGGTEAATYAAWDFNGRGGYRNIDGIMCIDGCAGAPFAGQHPVTVASAQAAIAQMGTKGPWLDLLGAGLPWVTGVFSQVGALAAVEAPDAPSLLQTFPLLPASFKPPKPVTNQAQLGFAFDASTSPASLALIQVHSGHVAATGDPAGWVDTGITPVQNVADMFAQAPLAAADWYYPERLSIDAGAAATLSQTPVATYLGLRLSTPARWTCRSTPSRPRSAAPTTPWPTGPTTSKAVEDPECDRGQPDRHLQPSRPAARRPVEERLPPDGRPLAEEARAPSARRPACSAPRS